MNTIQEFRDALRLRLKSKGIRQADLAVTSGVPQYAISRFLSGADLRGRYLVPLQAALSAAELPCLPPPAPPPAVDIPFSSASPPKTLEEL
jgi:transcriptional regulator with XRE-family HTH domain